MRKITTTLADLSYAIETARDTIGVSRAEAYDGSVPRIGAMENPLLSSISNHADRLGLTVNLQVEGINFDIPLDGARILFDSLVKFSGKRPYYFTSHGLIPPSAFGTRSLRAGYIQAAADTVGVEVKVIISF